MSLLAIPLQQKTALEKSINDREPTPEEKKQWEDLCVDIRKEGRRMKEGRRPDE